MEVVTGVFEARDDAERAVNQLRKLRGKGYSDVEDELRTSCSGVALDSGFREGYERGLTYHSKNTERRTG